MAWFGPGSGAPSRAVVEDMFAKGYGAGDPNRAAYDAYGMTPRNAAGIPMYHPAANPQAVQPGPFASQPHPAVGGAGLPMTTPGPGHGPGYGGTQGGHV